MAKIKTTISDHLHSSRYYSMTDDSLKDEDNVAWVMDLQENDRNEWMDLLKWVRIADRLFEKEAFQNSVKKFSYSFNDFLSSWKKLRATGEVNDDQFAALFKKLKTRWEKEKLGENDLKNWDLYLSSLVKYVRPNIVIYDM